MPNQLASNGPPHIRGHQQQWGAETPDLTAVPARAENLLESVEKEY